MNTKVKTALISTVVLVASFGMTGLVTAYVDSTDASYAKDTSSKAAETYDAAAAMQEGAVVSGGGYTVISCDGYICVYWGDYQGDPAICTDISISGLREKDKKYLEEGITLKNYDDVLKLLEDFSS